MRDTCFHVWAGPPRLILARLQVDWPSAGFASRLSDYSYATG